MLADEEVHAVITAVVAVGAVLAAALLIAPDRGEPFTAIGLLDRDCRIGVYPTEAHNGTAVDLCIFVYNHMRRPIYYMVVYRLGNSSLLPTNSTPSPAPALARWRGVLADGQNKTFTVSVPVYAGRLPANATLIFELWTYEDGWSYTGRWVHLHIRIRP